jgi:hypothetical protein
MPSESEQDGDISADVKTLVSDVTRTLRRNPCILILLRTASDWNALVQMAARLTALPAALYSPETLFACFW